MSDATSELVRRYEGRVLIEFSHFVLFDFFDYSSLADINTTSDSNWIGQSGLGGAIFHATDTNLEAQVSVEVWRGLPATLNNASSYSYTGTFYCSSGKMMLASVTGSPGDTLIELFGQGNYNVHAVRSPELVTTSLGDEGRCEQWNIAVWQ